MYDITSFKDKRVLKTLGEYPCEVFFSLPTVVIYDITSFKDKRVLKTLGEYPCEVFFCYQL
jgi:hypothetical protein